jgi:hypothetical protein
MNADERRSLDDLTERVLGAIFEVANTFHDLAAAKRKQNCCPVTSWTLH